MNCYSYKITRDYGFAPNPFFGYCTLACCKPDIRKKAEVGDWIIGTGAIENGLLNHLIYIMQVSEKIRFQDYWTDNRFARKKPVLIGSLKQIHGDNIYYKDDNQWYQLNSHHSHHEGKVNQDNLKQDLRGEFVLVSNHFYYLGSNHIKVPTKFIELCPNKTQRNYIQISNLNLINEFIEYITTNYDKGVIGEPNNWNEYKQLALQM